MKHILLTMFALLLLGSCQQPSFQEDERAIRAVMAQQEADWDAGDVRAFMNGYADSVCFIGSKGMTCGREAVTANYVRNYPDKAAMGDLTFSDLEILPAPLRLHVVAGRTGSGKSLILQSLAGLGAQVLDLEAMANHRGSVLGLMPEAVQPSQRRFESLLWETLRKFDPLRPVFVESESRRVGQCHLPDALIARMRAADCTLIEMSLEHRAALLLREYRHFTENPGALFERLERLVPLHGRRTVDAWQALASEQRWAEFVIALLEAHYDPAYDRSMARNYTAIGKAPRIELADDSEAALGEAARQLMTGGAA